MAFAIFVLAALPFFAVAARPSNTVSDAGKIYSLTLRRENGLLLLESAGLLGSRAGGRDNVSDGPFKADVLSMDDEKIYSAGFMVPDIACAGESDPESGVAAAGCKRDDPEEFTLSIPYFSNGKNIEIYDPEGNLSLTVDVSMFADLCGDGVCGEGENSGACPADCKTGARDGYCDGAADGVCDSECGASRDSDCAGAGIDDHRSLIVAAVIFFVAVALAGSAAVYLKTKRS